jgi:hypothetical protein
MRAFLRTGLWLAGVGAAAMGAVAFANLAAKQPVRTRAATGDLVAQDVANRVDEVLQERFRRPLDRVFGLSRVARPDDKKIAHSRSATPADTEKLAKAEEVGRAFRVFFYAMRSLDADGLKAIEFPHGEGLTALASSERAARRAIGEPFFSAARSELSIGRRWLERGHVVEGAADGWRLYARPILAEKSCVGCHSGAREGAPLGALVYAVEGPEAL